jgi:osmotically-inducible protein OsmY
MTTDADPSIIDEIRAALDSEPRLHNPSEIAVDERAGTVTLRGTVRSMNQRRVAIEVAKTVRGVRRVYDGLRIDPRDHWDDDQLRGAALQALIRSAEVPADQIDVEVRAGWLTLKGQVKHQSASGAAFDVVSRLAGVGGITNEIKVVSPSRDARAA